MRHSVYKAVLPLCRENMGNIARRVVFFANLTPALPLLALFSIKQRAGDRLFLCAGMDILLRDCCKRSPCR